MLPIVINEQQIFTFEFWFDDSLRYGMYYRSDLYCQLETFDISQRPQAYQIGCKLANQGTSIVLTLTDTTCSLWGSLRAPTIKAILLRSGDTRSILQNQGTVTNNIVTESAPEH